MDLNTPLDSISKSFKLYSKRLKSLSILTVNDLLNHIPFRYDDFTLISKISNVQIGEVVTIKGDVLEIKNIFTKNFKKIQKAVVADETGSINIVWFNQPFLAKYIKKNDSISISGRVDFFDRNIALISPEYEILTDATQPIHTGRLVPVYNETKGVSSKWLRRQIFTVLKKIQIKEILPEKIIKKYNLEGLDSSIRKIHFPSKKEDVISSRRRLGFDELIKINLVGLKKQDEWNELKTGLIFETKKFSKRIDSLIANLPFELTSSQKTAVDDIFSDLEKTIPMNRLLQGDVGSGKTVVASIAMFLAKLNGFQAVLMAPTEILAKQHFSTIDNLLGKFGVRTILVTGTSKKDMDKKSFDIMVGTHAVLYNDAVFENLGLVVIDEQQRFGVEQRSLIKKKGQNPHLLTMTATPIPRTVALTMYSNLKVSYLKEMPRGRKIIKTWLVPEEKRSAAYDWIKKQLSETGSQAFIVCPFIEESESNQTVKAAVVEHKRLQEEIFYDLKLGLLHGKLKSQEKQSVLEDFKNKKTSILVATPVVEVGIDITNATIILIEAAERFGLAQLHQLRGRVGRGDAQSYCLLFTESKNEQTLSKLKELEKINNGSDLAELDLRLRGPGDIFGIKQSGVSQLKIASFADNELLEETKNAAREVFGDLNSYKDLNNIIAEMNIKNVSQD